MWVMPTLSLIAVLVLNFSIFDDPKIFVHLLFSESVLNIIRNVTKVQKKKNVRMDHEYCS